MMYIRKCSALHGSLEALKRDALRLLATAVWVFLASLLLPPQTRAESQTVYVPSLNAKVTELRFFESDINSVPYEQRTYTTRFEKSKTRYINWELNLEYPAPKGRRVDFDINAVWYQSDGSVLTKQTKKAYVEADWPASYHTMGYGWDKPGNWEVGSYTVELSIKGKKVASGTFEIYEAETSTEQSGSPTGHISSLNADVTSLLFFESGYNPMSREQRTYSHRFARSKARYINWELNLEHPSQSRRVDFKIEAVWSRSDGSILRRQTLDTSLELGRTSSYHSFGYGWDDPGKWEVGPYKVELYVKGEKIAEDSFEIYEAGTSSESVTDKSKDSESPTGSIPSLNATVTALKFFEGSTNAPPREQRVYANRFDKSKTRYIFWELNLEHPAQGHPVDFSIEAIWYRPNNSVLRRQTLQTSLEADWTWSYHQWGFGWDKPGNWEVGSYQVDLYVDGKKVASDVFEVY